MNTQLSPTYLGKNVLVVIDPINGYLQALRSTVSLLSGIDHKSFTLFCCYPTHYREHSGAHNPDVQQEIEMITDKQKNEIAYARDCLKEVQAILQDAGVLESHIHTRVAANDTLINATMNELNQRHYTGIIVSNYHQDIVARLQRKGITDIFRKIPKIEIHTLELASEIAEPNM